MCVETTQSGVHGSLKERNKNIPALLEAAAVAKLHIPKAAKAFTSESGRIGGLD